jgi:hypothetical protein
MFGALLEALIMAIYRIIKGEVRDASKPTQAQDLGPLPPFLRSHWDDRVRHYLRDKKGSVRKGE